MYEAAGEGWWPTPSVPEEMVAFGWLGGSILG